MRYRSNPTEIEAMQYIDNDSIQDLIDWGVQVQTSLDLDQRGIIKIYNSHNDDWIKVPVGHFVARGKDNEFYPIEPATMWDRYICLGEVLDTHEGEIPDGMELT